MVRPTTIAITVLSCALLGCPSNDAAPTPRVGAAKAEEIDEAERQEAAPVVTPARTTAPPAELTRDELLALSPRDVLGEGLRGRGPAGLAPGLAGTGALALCEQLRAAGTPKEALALASIIFRRAAEQTAPGQRASEAVYEELTRNIAIQAGDQAQLNAWLPALQDASEFREDLAAAATFLGQAHLMWASVDRTRALGAKVRKG